VICPRGTEGQKEEDRRSEAEAAFKFRLGRDERILLAVLGACAPIWLVVQFLQGQFRRSFVDWL